MEEKNKKYSYEELLSICQELSRQNRELSMRLNEKLGLERLKLLIEIVKIGNNFNPVFLSKCIEEIQESMTIPEEVNPTENSDSETSEE